MSATMSGWDGQPPQAATTANGHTGSVEDPTSPGAGGAVATAAVAPVANGLPQITSKIYIGGLPETTRVEDLQDCFSQLGLIKQIELKRGYGFVEYDNAQSASDAVSKYHEGTFLGSPIKVELSRGGRSAKDVSNDACFHCNQTGHWARDCPQRSRRRRSIDESSSVNPRRADDGWSRAPTRQGRDRDPYPPAPVRDPYDRPPPPRDPYERPYERAAAPRDDYYARRDPVDMTRSERDYDRRALPPADRAPPPPVEERDRRYREPGRDLRDRVDPRGLPTPAPARDPYGAPPPSRDYYDDHRREAVYAKPPQPAEPYGYAPSRDAYDNRAAYNSRGYAAPPPEPVYGAVRPAYDDRVAPPVARYDDRDRLPPVADDRGRPRYDDRYTREPDRRDVAAYAAPPRDRSPPRRGYRRSLSPPRRGSTTAGSAYGTAPAYNGYSMNSSVSRAPPVDDYARGADRRAPMDEYDRGDRRAAPVGYGRSDPYAGRR